MKTIRLGKNKTNLDKKEKNKVNKKSPKLSNVVRPSGMELAEWQKALRRQAAEQEHLQVSVKTHTDEPGSYIVVNPSTDNEYKVIYRGVDCRWNYCSCMDFKTNCLGTCKHIEAVGVWLKRCGKPVNRTLPTYTAVYLLYQRERKVCIRIGTDNANEFEALASEYFTSDGCLKPNAVYSFSTFLSRAKRINDTFRCYPDALQYIIDLRDEKRRSALINEKASDDNLDTLLDAKLYPYQKEGIRFAVKNGKSIIADEMGLGKTIQAIGCAEFLRKEKFITSALVVCPTSLKYQWKKEIERFTGKNALVIEGIHSKRKLLYDDEAFYKIVSYNSLCNDMKVLRQMNVDFMIMDEAQRLKNWNTQIAKAMRRVSSDYMVVLSGTPLENKLQELYSIVQLVNPYALGPLYEFVDATTLLSPSGQVIGYKNLNAVGKRLKSVMIRRRKADVRLQLPSRIDNIRFVPVTKEQRSVHDEFNLSVAQIVMKWHKTRFLSEKDRKRLLLLLSQMRMVCDSTFILDQRSRHDTKIDELMLLIEDMLENGDDKMVVFSQWERMTRLVCQEMEKRSIGYANLNGAVPSIKRKELMDEFMSNPDCRVFVSTDAGCTGLNLQAASVLVNLDLPWNPAVLEQRIARIYRIGQEKVVHVFNMVSEGTIEERMLSTLNFKANMSEGILDNGIDAVFMEDSKFERLMETIEKVAASKKEPETEGKLAEEVFEEEGEVAERKAHDSLFDIEAMMEDQQDDASDADKEKLNDIACIEDSSIDSPEKLVSQGISFLQGLAETLSSSEKTQALVDAIVKEDKATGQTHIEIPVPDKQTVASLFSLFSKIISSVK